MIARILLSLSLMICCGGIGLHADVSKTLKARIFARYDHQNLVVMHDKILVTTVKSDPSSMFSYSINYDYFHPAFTDFPEKYKQRNRIDKYTTEEVQSSANFTDPMSIGESVRVAKLLLLTSKNNNVFVDMYMYSLDGKRVARMKTTYPDGYETTHEAVFGVHFRFGIPSKAPEASEDEYFAEIVKSINGYFVPVSEYHQTQKNAEAAAEARKNVNIEPGMPEEEIIKLLGEPQRRIQFGAKTILKYTDITVEIEDKKVSQVKVN